MGSIPFRLFVEWQEFYNLEPWGHQAEALRHAAPVAKLSQWLGNKRPKLVDFMPRLERKRKRSTGAEVKAACIGMARSFKKRGQ